MKRNRFNEEPKLAPFGSGHTLDSKFSPTISMRDQHPHDTFNNKLQEPKNKPKAESICSFNKTRVVHELIFSKNKPNNTAP